MKNILYIGNKLAKHGYNSTTIDTLGPLLESEGFHVAYASHYKAKSLRLLHMIYKVLSNARKTNLVLIDTYSTANFWYAIIIGKLCFLLNIPYIPILHGGNLPKRLETNKTFLESYLKNAKHVVCPSDFLKDQFLSTGTQKAKAIFSKIIVIPNNIILDDYFFKIRAALKPKLLWVRSFASIYNPNMALDVLIRLLDKYPDAHLTMVGPEKDGSLQQCKLRAQKHDLPVTFTGLLSKKIWVELSKDCDIFINTTRFDNVPVSVIEAMALGLPVVSTSVGGITYLVEHFITGLLVPDNDTIAMEEAIITLIENPESSRSITVSARDFIRQYNWMEIRLKWIALLS